MQENKPLISVNITTYNRSNLLPRCLDSVLKQNYDNLEVIIVDDNSNDNTSEVISKYTDLFPNILYIKHAKNMGNAHARNTAWENCSGDYIAFMDDDDEWIDPDKLIKQYNLIKNIAKPVICYTASISKFPNSIDINYKHVKGNVSSFILKGNGVIYSPTVLVNRKCLELTNGFETNITRGIDAEFYREAVFKHSAILFYLDEQTTTIYRLHDARMSTVVNRKGFVLDILNINFIMRKYAKELQLDSKAYAYWLQLLSRNYFKLYNSSIVINNNYLKFSLHYIKKSLMKSVSFKSSKYLLKVMFYYFKKDVKR